MSVKSWLKSASKRFSLQKVADDRRRRSLARRRCIEQLEDRRLLVNYWHNQFIPNDVNDDFRVSPIDALLIINKLNKLNKLDAQGQSQLPNLAPGVRPNAFYDTNDDGFITPIDALRVINGINRNTVSAGQNDPRLIDVVPVDGTTILATFNRPMGASAINPSNYSITTENGQAIEVLGASFGEGESVVQLQTAAHTSAVYTFNIENVADSIGQTVFFEGRKITGNPKGAVVSAAATSPTRVVIVFNEPMADNALAPQNYAIKDADGSSLLVTDAKFDGPLGMVVVLTTLVQANKPYKVTVLSVTDLQNDGLQSSITNFQGISGLTKLNAATPHGPNSILLNFSQSMSDDVLTSSSYVIKNSLGVTLPVLNAQFVGTERRLVHLATGPQKAGIYTIQSITAADIHGNLVAAPGSAGVFLGVPAPSLIAAIPPDATHVFLTFGSPLSDSGLAPSSYKLEKLDAQGNVTNTLPISEIAFVGNQRTVISLTTPHQSNSRYRISTTNGLFAVTGSSLAVVALEFQGLGSQPKVTNVTSTGPTSMLVTFNVSMSDDALAPASYVIKNSTGATLPVTNAQFVGTDRRLVELTTGPQIAGIYTIQSIAATDLGGSSVDPPGTAGEFEGAPAPTLSQATPSDPTHLVLVFSGPVGDSALAPSSYKIDKLDSQGSIVGSLTINSAAFVGDQRTVVSLTTPYQSDSRYQLTTTSALSDSTGKSLAIVRQEFTGVGSPATLVGITSIDPTTLQVIFNVPMSDDALLPSQYVIKDSSGRQLPIYNVQFIGTQRRLVQLTTGPQASNETYTVVSINATGTNGGTTIIPPSASISSFTGPGTSGGNSLPVDGPPRLTGAASLSNTSVLVAFSEPMDDNALNPSHYFIVQQNVNPEAGFVPILGAVFYSSDHRSVLLTTGSQNELTYSITAVNVTDQAGNALAPAVIAGQLRVDPTTAIFPGTPPAGGQIVDTDGDGLSDNVEVRGWTVTVTRLDGSTFTREVTSDPNNPDTDGDDLWDAQELNIGTDPRSADTDGDQLDDWAEFNEIYSDPTNQDSDGDSLDDFLEFTFFKTSPYLADSDGDQLTDGYEIFANRNPRVSDLPRPEISVGTVNLQLDVRFSETNDQQRRDLETKSVTSTLAKSSSQSFTRSDTVNLEAHMGLEVGAGDGTSSTGLYLRASAGASVGYTFDQTSESATETQQAYESSLSTDKEVTRGFTVERQVEGAVMQVAVDLRNVSSIAYRVKNLQLTAFIQDPQDQSRLTPVATLLADSEPEEGFTLGPLVAEKGPLIFSNDGIVPSLVESLMANSSGLVFRISNYDIIDESGRNFAFTSQEIVERTARLVVDYGGASSLRARLGGEAFDELQPGDETEIYRVATSAGQVIDTNFDGSIDGSDRRAIFDANGKEVGITIFEGLSAVGLTRYDEATTPSQSLSDKQILGSYSTFIAPAEVIGGIQYPAREKMYRIRGISNDTVNQKYWEILTPLGIDQVTDLNELILKTDSPVSLNFVQDLDSDGLSADVEFFLRTSDSPMTRGAEVPGTTDFNNEMSVKFSTDPGYVTGAIVRVHQNTALDPITQVPSLFAGTNYFVRSLGFGAYSFYNSSAAANTDTARIPLRGKVTTGLFAAPKPTSTNSASAESVTYSIDPLFPTASIVQVTATGGGLSQGQNYFVRNLGGGSYSFYDSPEHATAGSASTAGRIDLTGNITAGIFSPTAKGRDTDNDGLDDRFEALIGWTVSTPQRTFKVYSSPNRADSNFDAPKLGVDSDGDGIQDRLEYSGSDLFAAPAGWRDQDLNGLRGQFEIFQLSTQSGIPDYVLDPSRKDTDSDGINDGTEIIGFRITPITGDASYWVTTDPNSPFTDSDTFSDGLERLLGLDPTNGSDTDEDGDGLPDLIETLGWTVYTFGVSTQPYTQGAYEPGYDRHVTPNATDLTAEVVKFNTNNDPNIQRFALVMVTGGGLVANSPYFLGKLVEQPDPNSVRYSLYVSATDAAAGKARGAQNLTGPITDIHIAADSRKQSRTDSVDSDEDGLTDYEEFFLGTNPSSVDSDADGIEDRIEHLGYALGHKVGGADLGFIKTNPLDADTDNDKRSDGAEAELVDVELARWVVRVRGETPYQVFSNPLVADADFDGLVDGDEFNLEPLFPDRRTDPNKGNTDGDDRDDGVERGKTNPLARDIRVTVVAESVEISTRGQYNYAINVKQPDSRGVAGLSTTPVLVFKSDAPTTGVGSLELYNTGAYNAKISYYYIDSAGNPVLTDEEADVLAGQTRTFDPGLRGVPLNTRFFAIMRAVAGGSNVATEEFIYTGNAAVARYRSGGTTLINRSFTFQGIAAPVDLPQANVPLALRSSSFGLASDERFSIEGFFTVITPTGSTTVNLGGLEGKRAKQEGLDGTNATESRSVYSYIQVADKFIEDYYFEFTVDDVTVTLKFYFIIG